MKKTAIILTIILLLSSFRYAFAGPTSSTYELKDYTFGAGGTGETGVTGASNYTIFGTAGETDATKLNGASLYSIGGGLNYTLQASVSAAPAFTNPASNYDRLKLIMDSAIGPSDTKYAVAISSDNFSADTRYIQNDFTVGGALGSEDWLTYPQWNRTTGVFVTGLTNNTTYYVKVKTKQGSFTEGPWSTVSSATTSNPILTFSLSSSSVTFTSLNAGNSYTDSAKTTTLTTTTNAYNGYTVYAKETQALTAPGGGTISNFGSTNGSPASWSGTGFGYTTDDSSLAGGTANRFTNGGAKYAGFTTSASTPGDPVADHTAVIQDPTVTGEQFIVTYRVTGDATTPAGTYTNTLIYTIVPVY